MQIDILRERERMTGRKMEGERGDMCSPNASDLRRIERSGKKKASPGNRSTRWRYYVGITSGLRHAKNRIIAAPISRRANAIRRMPTSRSRRRVTRNFLDKNAAPDAPASDNHCDNCADNCPLINGRA